MVGRPIAYEQIGAWELKKRAPNRSTDTFWQHLQEIAKDHQNGVFAGTNDTVLRITGQHPLGLPDFLEANKAAFAR